MALSFCSSSGTLQQQNCYPDLTAFSETVPDQLLAWDDSVLIPSDGFINPFNQLDEFFYSDASATLLPYFSSPSENNAMFLAPEIFPPEEFDSCPCPKRQKSYVGHYLQPNPAPYFLQGYVGNAAPVQEMLPEIPTVPEKKFQVEATPTFAVGRTTETVKKPGGVSMSAQSIAARERRRKIAEKTQELGKLIPGGNKMNTAEMFQAASKYVKFLEAQIKILNLMGSTQEREGTLNSSKQLQNLVTSPTIQEKLYSQEKCLVPREFMETIADDHAFQFNANL